MVKPVLIVLGFLKRIKILNENRSESNGIIETNLKQSVDIHAYEELEEKLSDQVLLNQRRMEAFERKSKQVLNTFKLLSGFKITFVDKLVKLSSIYTKDKENFLLFKLHSNGTLSLIESEFATKYSKYVSMYLQSTHSIPAYLAAITFDLLKLKFTD